MLIVNDAVDAVLLGCFFFGLFFAVVSVALGGLDLGGGDGAGHDDAGIGPVNLSTLLAFVAWFGGFGYLARNALGWVVPLSIAVGIAGGLLGGYAVYQFLARVIAPADHALDPADYELPGTIARVSSSIRAGGTGEVVYEQAGARQVSAARSTAGEAIAQGTEVVILDSRAGIAMVQPWADLMAEREDRLAPSVRDRDPRPLVTDRS